MIGKKITIFNKDGESQTVEFAKPSERVTNESGNRGKVIDKLKQKNDRNSQIAVANIENLVEVSFEDSSVTHSEENNHQWLDANGWDFRFAYMEMPNGKIYSVQLNIANTADGRKILYDINKISECGLDTMLVDEASTASQNSQFADKRIPQEQNNVKKNSLSNANDDIAPVRERNNVYGEDIKLEPASAEDIAPTAEDIKNQDTLVIDDAPIKDASSSAHNDLVNQMSDIMDETTESDVKSNNVSQEFIEKNNKSFGIEKPNDYVHVQKQVFNTLKNEGFFTGEDNSRIDYNEDSGMVIETNKKGIKETFNGDNYSNLGKEKKALKLATIRKLPEIIKNGKLIADDVDNYHNKSSVTRFAYIESEIEVDGKDVSVKIDIKKSPQKNKFWVHSVRILEKANEQPAVASGAIKRANDSSAYKDSVPNPTEDVKEDLPDYFVDSENKQETKLTRKGLYEDIIAGIWLHK